MIQYIYRKYGRERAGLAATVISYRARSAIRDVGKVFGLSEDAITALSGTRWGSSSREIGLADIQRAGFNPKDKHLRQMLDLAQQIVGFPRHLSQHVGGFLITRDRLSSLIPIENAAMEDRTIVEWDKDDLNALNMLKIDVLALGHADLPAQGLRPAGNPLRPPRDARLPARRRHAHLRHDLPGGHDRRVPDREPGRR